MNLIVVYYCGDNFCMKFYNSDVFFTEILVNWVCMPACTRLPRNAVQIDEWKKQIEKWEWGIKMLQWQTLKKVCQIRPLFMTN